MAQTLHLTLIYLNTLHTSANSLLTFCRQKSAENLSIKISPFSQQSINYIWLSPEGIRVANVTNTFWNLVMTGLADVDRFILCIQVCVWLGSDHWLWAERGNDALNLFIIRWKVRNRDSIKLFRRIIFLILLMISTECRIYAYWFFYTNK